MTDYELSKILDELRRLGSHLDECNRQLQWTMDEVYNIGDDNLIIL